MVTSFGNDRVDLAGHDAAEPGWSAGQRAISATPAIGPLNSSIADRWRSSSGSTAMTVFNWPLTPRRLRPGSLRLIRRNRDSFFSGTRRPFVSPSICTAMRVGKFRVSVDAGADGSAALGQTRPGGVSAPSSTLDMPLSRSGCAQPPISWPQRAQAWHPSGGCGRSVTTVIQSRPPCSPMRPANSAKVPGNRSSATDSKR